MVSIAVINKTKAAVLSIHLVPSLLTLTDLSYKTANFFQTIFCLSVLNDFSQFLRSVLSANLLETHSHVRQKDNQNSLTGRGKNVTAINTLSLNFLLIAVKEKISIT